MTPRLTPTELQALVDGMPLDQYAGVLLGHLYRVRDQAVDEIIDACLDVLGYATQREVTDAWHRNGWLWPGQRPARQRVWHRLRHRVDLDKVHQPNGAVVYRRHRRSKVA